MYFPQNLFLQFISPIHYFLYIAMKVFSQLSTVFHAGFSPYIFSCSARFPIKRCRQAGLYLMNTMNVGPVLLFLSFLTSSTPRHNEKFPHKESMYYGMTSFRYSLNFQITTEWLIIQRHVAPIVPSSKDK